MKEKLKYILLSAMWLGGAVLTFKSKMGFRLMKIIPVPYWLIGGLLAFFGLCAFACIFSGNSEDNKKNEGAK